MKTLLIIILLLVPVIAYAERDCRIKQGCDYGGYKRMWDQVVAPEKRECFYSLECKGGDALPTKKSKRSNVSKNFESCMKLTGDEDYCLKIVEKPVICQNNSDGCVFDDENSADKKSKRDQLIEKCESFLNVADDDTKKLSDLSRGAMAQIATAYCTRALLEK